MKGLKKEAKMTCKIFAGFFLGLLIQSQSVWATTFTYEFVAEVSSFYSGQGNFLQDNFDLNDSVTGRFSFDDEASGTYSTYAGYFNQAGNMEFEATIDGITFQRGGFYRTQTTNYVGTWDRLEVVTFNPTDNGLVYPSGFRISSMKLDFKDLTISILPDLEFPSGINLYDWTSAILNLQVANSNGFVDSEMFATLTSLNLADGPVSVPEPTTMLLFVTGIAGLAGTRSRIKKK